jgi:hypothetical protein
MAQQFTCKDDERGPGDRESDGACHEKAEATDVNHSMRDARVEVVGGGRLRELDPERLLYGSTKPGSGGNGPLLLTPLELLHRIAALVPPPRVHRHRYLGVLARTAAHGKFPLRP